MVLELNLMHAVLAMVTMMAVGSSASIRAESRPAGPREAEKGSSRGHHHDRRSFDERGPRFHLFRDGPTTGSSGAGFRQAMMEDLRDHVPLLHAQMQAVFAIQQERQHLQVQKREAARASERSEAKLQRFHELVRRDDTLTSRQRALLVETAAGAEAIRAQVALRRSELEARLLELESDELENPERAQDAETTEIRFLTRAIRTYGFLDSRLAALQENPRNPEWMRPLLKGMFFAGGESDDSRRGDGTERRLQQLQEEEENLRRRLHWIQREIEALGGSPPGKDGGKPASHRRPGREAGGQAPGPRTSILRDSGPGFCPEG